MLLVFAVAWCATLFGQKQGKHVPIGEELDVRMAAGANARLGRKEGVASTLGDEPRKQYPQWYREGGNDKAEEGRIAFCRSDELQNDAPMYPEAWKGEPQKKSSMGNGVDVWIRNSDWDVKVNPIPEVPVETAQPVGWKEAAATVPPGEIMVWTLVGGKAYQASMLTFKAMMDDLSIKHAAFVCLDDICLQTAASLNMIGLSYEFKGDREKRVGGIKFGATAAFAALGVPALFMVSFVSCSSYHQLAENMCASSGTRCVLQEESAPIFRTSIRQQHYCIRSRRLHKES